MYGCLNVINYYKDKIPKSNIKNTSSSSSGRQVGKTAFINSKTSSAIAFRVRVANDMTRRPLAPDINKMSMPKSIDTQIHWFTADFSVTGTLNAGGITEVNTSFSLSQCPIVNAITSLFDQYAIFAVYARLCPITTGLGVGIQRFFSALDYDNVTNLGTVAQIQGYSTVTETDLSMTQERYIEPCNAPALYSGSVFTHFGQSRMWVDTANSSTPHYGLRVMYDALGAGGVGTYSHEFSVVICARNSF
jgi:hypothetical protein